MILSKKFKKYFRSEVTAGLVTLDSYVPWYVLLLQGVS